MIRMITEELTMKLKDHPKLSPRYLVLWGFTEQKPGPINHPNMRQEQFCKEAVILKVWSEPLPNHSSVVFNVKHPKYPTGVTGSITLSDKQLASNLLQTAQEFLGKTVEKLDEAEVTDEMFLLTA
jgi:hypothetical protein